ncbi:peptidoglycan-associated lipoprotein Pal [Ovoidimarina sediminis]|uniref:peptidoglycan-associated lipoprotein Pal n=1 Tax=Ovoidimarina sediminis TaxID=3079856 RepID=UPI002906517C|nr:peptidoglycan-associated lipoprotein Pal [Rhodophyticola sp. MJ-SS7]MDU8946517.1 peptidoglycan-associated lipoprotein Pal [Rhodophyticola sp. MJ-SS7]
MTLTSKALLLIAAGALAACSTSADRFGAGGFGSGAGGIDQTGLGDPTSVAYFQSQVGDRVLFVVDTSTLTPQAEETLRGQAQFLMANGDYTAIIEGHADERGTREYNLALGARRAASVRDFLVAQGVAANRLRTVTYGKERPLEICSEEACYAQNRRAVTVLGAAGLGS